MGRSRDVWQGSQVTGFSLQGNWELIKDFVQENSGIRLELLKGYHEEVGS